MDTTTILIGGAVLLIAVLLAAWGLRNRRLRRAEDARYSGEVTAQLAHPPSRRAGLMRKTRDDDRARRTRELQPPHPTLSDEEVDRRIAASQRLFDDGAQRERDAAPTDPGLPVVGELGGGFHDRPRHPTRNAPRVDDVTAMPFPPTYYDGYGAPINNPAPTEQVQHHRTDHQVDYTPTSHPASSHDSGGGHSGGSSDSGGGSSSGGGGGE